MCQFQSLYFDNECYVVRCKQCSCIQIAFGTTLLSLSEEDFSILGKVVKLKCSEVYFEIPADVRNVAIPTPAAGMCMLLTLNEANRLLEILDEAENELKAQEMMNLFNS